MASTSNVAFTVIIALTLAAGPAAAHGGKGRPTGPRTHEVERPGLMTRAWRGLRDLFGGRDAERGATEGLGRKASAAPEAKKLVPTSPGSGERGRAPSRLAPEPKPVKSPAELERERAERERRAQEAARARAEAAEKRAADLMKEAERLTTFEQLGYQDSYGGGPGDGPLTILRTGEGEPAARYVWFHGAGQKAKNEMVVRLARAFQEAGLNLEVVSVPYQDAGRDVVRALIEQSPGKLLVGGHSAGGSVVDEVLSAAPDKIAGVVTFNPAVSLSAFASHHPRVPSLHFVGQNDFGGSHLSKDHAWNDGQHIVETKNNGTHRVAIMREGDHSARYRVNGDHDKESASASAETRAMNVAAASHMKSFLSEIGAL
jgi:pimeloyl-ACP methyl ester carboxylesterase